MDRFVFLFLIIISLIQSIESFAQVDTTVNGFNSDINSEIERSQTYIYEQSLRERAEVAKVEEKINRAERRYSQRLHRKLVKEDKNVCFSILGAPSYTPETSFGIGGAMVASFKTDRSDNLSYRSYIPIGFNVSLNGTIMVAGLSSLFFNENRFRIYTTYSFKDHPTHYYGKGYESIMSTEKGDSTTLFNKQSLLFYPKFVWEVKPKFYLGALFEINHTTNSDINPRMAEDSYFNMYNSSYTNIGLGCIIEYDSRDNIATAHNGILLSSTSKFYGKYIGGNYNYQIFDLEYRQFQPLFKRSTLAWTLRSQIGFNDIPFTELPMFGSPFDLRGYYWGQYRDKSMGYGIVEYREMFRTEESYAQGSLLSRFGYVAWIGAGTIGDSPLKWNRLKLNYGVGFRMQIQPQRNFRIDIGKAEGTKGVQLYMNMCEAF